jgi:hypothetical protein
MAQAGAPVLLLRRLIHGLVTIRIINCDASREGDVILKRKAVEKSEYRFSICCGECAQSRLQVERYLLGGTQAECRLRSRSEEHHALAAEEQGIISGLNLRKKSLHDPSGHLNQGSVIEDLGNSGVIKTCSAEFLHDPRDLIVSSLSLGWVRAKPELNLEYCHRINCDRLAPLVEDTGFHDSVGRAPTADISEQLKQVLERTKTEPGTLSWVLRPVSP